jgi:hypothetical protein
VVGASGGDPVGRLHSAASGRWSSVLLRGALAGCASLVALATTVTALLGGFDPVRADKVPNASLGQQVSGRPWNVTVVGVRLLPDGDPLFHGHPGDRWIAVIADVEVTGQESMAVGDAVRLPDLPGLRHVFPDSVVLARDGQPAVRLQPGVPERVGLVWEQDARVPVPSVTDVQVIGETYGMSSLTGDLVWRAPEPSARVPAVRIDDRRR